MIIFLIIWLIGWTFTCWFLVEKAGYTLKWFGGQGLLVIWPILLAIYIAYKISLDLNKPE